MKLVIKYDNGLSEIVSARPQANIISTCMSLYPGIELVAEPKFCRWGSDFFSAAINEGNLRSGHEIPFEDDDASVLGFHWALIGTELEDCLEMMVRWINRLGKDFDPERGAEDYLYGGLLHMLAEDEAEAYANDQKCWMFYLDNPREDATLCFRTAGLDPSGIPKKQSRRRGCFL